MVFEQEQHMQKRWLKVLVAALLLVLTDGSVLRAETIAVATREMPPFSFMGKNGVWEGMAIELLEELAEEIDLEYRLEEVETIDELFAGVQDGRYALAVSGITITSDREKIIDFSQPFLSSSLAVGHERQGSPWHHVVRRVLSLEFILFAAVFILLLFVVGWLVWLVEHKTNPEFAEHRRRGIGSGFWWAAVTMTTVGYGDKTPKSSVGRILAVIWMFSSVIIVSMFTATVVSSLTEGTLVRNQTVAGLLEGKIGTVRSSTGAKFLEAYNLVPVSYDNITQAIEALSSNTVESVVYDLPVLQYYQRTMNNDVDVMAIPAQRQDYGIVMQQDASFRNDLNVALLHFIRSGDWQRIRERYIGEIHTDD